MDTLPVKKDISSFYTLSLVLALLLAGASLAGLLFQVSLYPDEALRQSSVATDVVNLLIVLPVLLCSMALARRGRLIGLLFWPGALFIVTYHYLAYAAAMSSIWQFAVYLALALLSIFIIYNLLSSLDSVSIQNQLSGRVPERFAGGVLIGFGILFLLWRGGLVVQSLIGSAVLSKPEFATAIADVLLAPVWVIVGASLWRKQAFGYVSGPGLLFQFNMLFIGLYVYFALQSIVAGIPFPIGDFAAVFVMGLACLIPFILFVRGILGAQR